MEAEAVELRVGGGGSEVSIIWYLEGREGRGRTAGNFGNNTNKHAAKFTKNNFGSYLT